MTYRIKSYDVVNDLHFLEQHLFLCFWKKVGFGSTSKLNGIIDDQRKQGECNDR
jgi:hypothetical protein